MESCAAGATSDDMFSMPAHMQAILGEGQKLVGRDYEERAYRFRDRAQKIFDAEKQRFLDSRYITPGMRLLVEPFRLCFDRGTTRRGVCKHRDRMIGLSALMVDGGVRAEKVLEVVRHELTHAALPKDKHGEAWKALNLKMGGDGKRCCQDAETRDKIGFKIVLACSHVTDVMKDPKASGGHCHSRRQKAPSTAWLRGRQCCKCARERRDHTLKVYRVSKSAS